MGKKLGILLGLVVLIIIAEAILSKSGADEGPVYNGRSLKNWVNRLPAHVNTAHGIMWGPLVKQKSGDELEAEVAVRAIGANAVPFLLADMRSQKQGASETFRSVSEPAVIWFERNVLHRRVNRPPMGSGERSAAELDHWQGANGLRALGPLARPALPELVKMLNAGGDQTGDAAYAIAAMGPEGEAALIGALTNSTPTSWTTACAVWALGQTPTNAAAAVPQMLLLLQKPAPLAHMGVAWALGEIRTAPELVVPALLTELTNTPPTSMGVNSRWAVMRALKNYGFTSTSSPALRDWLNNTNAELRIAATNVVQLINAGEISDHMR